MTTSALRIGDAAARLGVAPHVLRHWEDAGVLVPARARGGQRIYDAELLARARLIRLCQRTGMSLSEIRALGSAATATERAELIARKQSELRRTAADLHAVVGFLGHVLDCRHPMVSECPQCAWFSRAAQPVAE